MKKIVALLLAVLMLSLTACGGSKEEVKNIDLQGVYEEMAALMPEMLPMDETMMLNFCGIEADMCKQAVVSVCFDGLRADEVWLIEAKDAKALESLKGLAESRLERKGEESITYSPEQYQVVQKAEVITLGNYLVMIVSPNVADLTAIFNQAAN